MYFDDLGNKKNNHRSLHELETFLYNDIALILL